MLPLILILLFVLLLLGLPMFIVLIVPTFFSILIFEPRLSLTVMPQQILDGINVFPLLAIPLFIFAAMIMSHGKTSRQLVNFVSALVGHIPGGVAHTTIGACTIFGAISGSHQAAVVSIGEIMFPKLKEIGYSDSFNLALIINSSDISALIPPSIIMILYGVTVGASVGELFLAGIGPGLVIAFFFMIYAYFRARRDKVYVKESFNFKAVAVAFKNGLWAFGLPLIIIGGIYMGIFSPTEAAAVAVIYAMFVEMIVYRALSPKDLYKVAQRAGLINAVIFILIGGGQLFSWFLSYSGVPRQLIDIVVGIDPSPLVFLLLVNVIFFISCMLIEPAAAIIVVTPLIYPIAMGMGVDPIHLGIIITMQVAIGSATPPFGVDIFTAMAAFDKKYLEVIKDTPVFIGILLIIALLVTVFPSFALFTRNILM